MLFPIRSKKHHNFIIAKDAEVKKMLLPASDGDYVVVKRFTTVEEKKRISAAVWSGGQWTEAPAVCFENRVNYFHAHGTGMPPYVASGLAAFLNSSEVDEYFRQFNGSTQVNASDLRYLKYPSVQQLVNLGRKNIVGSKL